jgi:hypothetical protein
LPVVQGKRDFWAYYQLFRISSGLILEGIVPP